MTGRIEELEEPNFEFRVHLIDLTSDDRHNMQLNPEHIPNPVVGDRRSGVFHLPLGHHIVYVTNFVNLLVCQLTRGPLISFHRLLENERLLLVVADRDKHAIYLESLAGVDAAIQRARPIKTLNRDKMGEEVLFTYDEVKQTLAVCASAKVCAIHILVECGNFNCCVIQLDGALRVCVRRDLQDASKPGKCHQSSSVVRQSGCLNLATVIGMWKRRGNVGGLPRAGPDFFIHHTADQVSRCAIVVIRIGSLTRYTDWDARY